MTDKQLVFGFVPPATPNTGKQRKEWGVKQVLDHSDGWKDRAVEIIKKLAAQKAEFTSDDVRELADESGLPKPHHVNAWGAAMSAAAAQGIMSPTGRFAKSARPEAHARIIGVWRSNI